MARKREPIRQRLIRTIKKSGDCWLWQGSKTKDGYGVLTIGRKQYRAHRISYSEFTGDIPENIMVCHECDIPLCINPEHLFLGTAKENTQDMIKKGRKVIVSGFGHPHRRLSNDDYIEIKKMRKAGSLLKEIASIYKIAFQTVSNICNGDKSYGTK